VVVDTCNKIRFSCAAAPDARPPETVAEKHRDEQKNAACKQSRRHTPHIVSFAPNNAKPLGCAQRAVGRRWVLRDCGSPPPPSNSEPALAPNLNRTRSAKKRHASTGQPSRQKKIGRSGFRALAGDLLKPASLAPSKAMGAVLPLFRVPSPPRPRGPVPTRSGSFSFRLPTASNR
jgi:hypothetical protein